MTRLRIQNLLDSNAVVLFMKGTPDLPQCGFSASAVKFIRESGCKKFFSVNVLEDPEIRQGIKEYGNWPTIPQLYVKGELIGGCDILREMFHSGELSRILNAVV